MERRRKSEVDRKANPEDAISDESWKLVRRPRRRMQYPMKVGGWFEGRVGECSSKGSWRLAEGSAERRWPMKVGCRSTEEPEDAISDRSWTLVEGKAGRFIADASW